MRIVVKSSGRRYSILLLAGAAFAAASVYFHFKAASAGATISSAVLAAIALSTYALLTEMNPVLIVDEDGIFDKRLGVGKIPWRDVEDVSIETGYGNRFLCLKVRNPQLYVSKVKGKRKQKILFHQSLGFTRFNINVRQLNVGLLDLKQAVETRMASSK